MKIMNTTTGSENDKAMKYVKEYWRLGPEVASIHFDDNKEYWNMIGAVWIAKNARSFNHGKDN